jgi:hypothetical protein
MKLNHAQPTQQEDVGRLLLKGDLDQSLYAAWIMTRSCFCAA